MRKFIYSTILYLSVFNASAQDMHLNLYGGTANYSGDLQSKGITFDQSLFTIGAGLSYEFSEKIMLRSAIHFAKLNAQDQYQQNTLRRLRNLSFATNLWELNAIAEYHFLGLSNSPISPYVMGGLAVFNYNSYAFAPVASGGQKVYLKPLSTEGQGLSGTNKSTYSLTQLALPFGIGVRMKLTDRIGVGAEFGYRKTFTDYLDDVSGRYVDQATLLSQRGPLAVQMAFRTPELPGYSSEPYPVNNSLRGGTAKDNYYFILFSLNYRITGGGRNSGGMNGSKKYRSKMGCPTNVW